MLIDLLGNTDRTLRTFVTEDDGVTAIEYGLLASLIAVVCIASFRMTGVSLGDVYAKWTAAVIAAL